MPKRERLTDSRKDEIQGMADTLQWGRDCDAAEAMLDLLFEIEALNAELTSYRTIDDEAIHASSKE